MQARHAASVVMALAVAITCPALLVGQTSRLDWPLALAPRLRESEGSPLPWWHPP
jgi:hypothetical protein